MLKYLVLAAAILLASNSLARADSVSKAVDIVNNFNSETETLTKGLLSPSLQEQLAGEKAGALNALDTLDWTEKPGKRRSSLVYSTVDSYTAKVIDSIDEVVLESPPSSREALQNAVDRLSSLKTAAMRELNEALKAEAREQDRTPVPLIDRSPFEAPPEEAPGIWFR
ncbi:MAG: hypothetical protein HY893_00795 [Deltaproteobacteria bacterium]|nr:hypothetical protein [Deltaproteobacteria bacterium]